MLSKKERAECFKYLGLGEYTEENINEILTDVITEYFSETGAIAGILYAAPGVDRKAMKLAADHVTQVVSSQQYPFFMFEAAKDIDKIEHMFSNAECFVHFKAGGRVTYTSEQKTLEGANLRENKLVDILGRLRF